MTQRLEFILLARQEGVAFGELCRRYRISVKTGWKWRKRYAEGGVEALADRSRRPRHSPGQVSVAQAEQVLALHREHPTWGARKLHDWLRYRGEQAVPAASTCQAILRRAGVRPADPTTPRPWRRFERSQPNALWQMDYKGHFATQSGQRCHPLTVVDDHSRYNLVLAALANQTGLTVQQHLTQAFGWYGLPDALLCDNGSPWGHGDSTCRHTTLTVWLLRLGVEVLHGRPYHPETQGKDERFHRTLAHDLICRHTWRDLPHCQEHFDRFREQYNCERPHDALGGVPPINRYRPSPRALPATLPPVEYPLGVTVRVLPASGYLMFHGQCWYIGEPFGGLPLGLSPHHHHDGLWRVCFGATELGCMDFTAPRQPKRCVRFLLDPCGEADRLPCSPSANTGEGREPSPLP